MSDRSREYKALTQDDVPRFASYLNEELEAAGLVLVPKDVLTAEQQQHIRRIQVRAITE